jgi:hypothetical protein
MSKDADTPKPLTADEVEGLTAEQVAADFDTFKGRLGATAQAAEPPAEEEKLTPRQRISRGHDERDPQARRKARQAQPKREEDGDGDDD